jgi:hypothetical protein
MAELGYRRDGLNKYAFSLDVLFLGSGQYNAWLESLSEDDFARVSSHVGEHGSWPADLRPPVEWFALMP